MDFPDMFNQYRKHEIELIDDKPFRVYQLNEKMSER